MKWLARWVGGAPAIPDGSQLPSSTSHLVIGLPAKYDRDYQDGDVVLNLARLECACDDWTSRRATFPPGDARRVCAHLYNKLYQTKAEKAFGPLLQLFIRYGRTMYAYRVVEDDLGVAVIGQPFGPTSIRAIAVLGSASILATLNLGNGEWNTGETPMDSARSRLVLERMRVAVPAIVPVGPIPPTFGLR